LAPSGGVARQEQQCQGSEELDARGGSGQRQRGGGDALAASQAPEGAQGASTRCWAEAEGCGAPAKGGGEVKALAQAVPDAAGRLEAVPDAAGQLQAPAAGEASGAAGLGSQGQGSGGPGAAAASLCAAAAPCPLLPRDTPGAGGGGEGAGGAGAPAAAGGRPTAHAACGDLEQVADAASVVSTAQVSSKEAGIGAAKSQDANEGGQAAAAATAAAAAAGGGGGGAHPHPLLCGAPAVAADAPRLDKPSVDMESGKKERQQGRLERVSSLPPAAGMGRDRGGNKAGPADAGLEAKSFGAPSGAKRTASTGASSRHCVVVPFFAASAPCGRLSGAGRQRPLAVACPWLPRTGAPRRRASSGTKRLLVPHQHRTPPPLVLHLTTSQRIPHPFAGTLSRVGGDDGKYCRAMP